MNFCLGLGLGQLTSEGSKWKLTSEGSQNKNEMKSKWRPEAKANKNQKTQRQKSYEEKDKCNRGSKMIVNIHFT
jgi:hypothetical protein